MRKSKQYVIYEMNEEIRVCERLLTYQQQIYPLNIKDLLLTQEEAEAEIELTKIHINILTQKLFEYERIH